MEQLAGMWGKLQTTVFGSVEPIPRKTNVLNEKSTYTDSVCCTICEDVLTTQKDPRLLSCDHAFCFDCLQNIEYGKVIKCPQCKMPSVLDDSGIGGLEKFIVKEENKFDNRKTDDFSDETPPLSKSFVDVPLTQNMDDRENDDIQVEEEVVKQEDDFIVLENKPVKLTPQYYLPFTQQKELCKVLINHWISSIWFPPSDLNETIQILDSTPVYVPFYSFTVVTETVYTAQIGTLNEEGEVIWNLITGTSRNKYDELMTCASYSVNRNLVHELLQKPNSFSLQTGSILPPELPPYRVDQDSDIDSTPSSLPMSNEILKVDFGVEDGFNFAAGRRKINQWEENHAKTLIKSEHNTDKIKDLLCKTKFKKDYFIVLLPVYLSGFAYGGANYDVVLSGNKGVIEGQRPYGSGMFGKIITDAVNKVTKVVTDSI